MYIIIQPASNPVYTSKHIRVKAYACDVGHIEHTSLETASSASSALIHLINTHRTSLISAYLRHSDVLSACDRMHDTP